MPKAPRLRLINRFLSTSEYYFFKMESKFVNMTEDGKRQIRLHHLKSSPDNKEKFGILYIPGFLSGSQGHKSLKLLEDCKVKGREFISYDPEVIGDSTIQEPEKLKFSHWLEDAEKALDHAHTERGVVVIGSSLGGHIALKLANKRPEKVKHLLLIAPAVNLLPTKYDLLKANTMSKEEVALLEKGQSLPVDRFREPDAACKNFRITEEFFKDMKKHLIDFSHPLKLNEFCNVRILHGNRDDIVPVDISSKVMRVVDTEKCDLVIRKDAGINSIGLKMSNCSLNI